MPTYKTPPSLEAPSSIEPLEGELLSPDETKLRRPRRTRGIVSSMERLSEGALDQLNANARANDARQMGQDGSLERIAHHLIDKAESPEERMFHSKLIFGSLDAAGERASKDHARNSSAVEKTLAITAGVTLGVAGLYLLHKAFSSDISNALVGPEDTSLL